MKRTIRQFAQFGIVGGIGLAENAAVVFTLTEWAGFHYLVSLIFGTSVAMVSNYTLNRLWTFRRA